MKYQQVETAFFIDRPNRFIANCVKKDGEAIIAHVKNTGRGKEVLISGAEVAVAFAPGPKRKTNYDLIAVKKSSSGSTSTVNFPINWRLTRSWTGRSSCLVQWGSSPCTNGK